MGGASSPGWDSSCTRGASSTTRWRRSGAGATSTASRSSRCPTGQDRRVAEPGDPAACDAILALGGDGTTLAALRTGAAVGRPVMGVACGSLGALTAVTADDLERRARPPRRR